jgi:hypothetical protein
VGLQKLTKVLTSDFSDKGPWVRPSGSKQFL